MPKRIEPAVKERAVNLVFEHQAEDPSLFAVKARPPAARTVAEAQVVDAIRDVCWTVDHQGV